MTLFCDDAERSGGVSPSIGTQAMSAPHSTPRELTRALQQVHVSRERFHSVVARRNRLSVSQLICLCYLHVDGAMASNTIASLLGVTPSAVTSIVGMLVRRGLAVRLEDPEDRRVTLVAPTAAGSAVVDELTGLLVSNLSAGSLDMDQATAMLLQISAALEDCAVSAAAE